MRLLGFASGGRQEEVATRSTSTRTGHHHKKASATDPVIIMPTVSTKSSKTQQTTTHDGKKKKETKSATSHDVSAKSSSSKGERYSQSSAKQEESEATTPRGRDKSKKSSSKKSGRSKSRSRSESRSESRSRSKSKSKRSKSRSKQGGGPEERTDDDNDKLMKKKSSSSKSLKSSGKSKHSRSSSKHKKSLHSETRDPLDTSARKSSSGSRSRSRSRSHSKSSKKSKKKKSRKSTPRTTTSGGGGAPLIDRVPTAMGYDSDDSVEDLLEERSRYSRYSVDPVEDRIDLLTDEEEEEGGAEDDHPGLDDKYSSRAPSSIDRLWSESTEDAPHWTEESKKQQSPSRGGSGKYSSVTHGRRSTMAQSRPPNPEIESTWSEPFVPDDEQVNNYADPIYSPPSPKNKKQKPKTTTTEEEVATTMTTKESSRKMSSQHTNTTTTASTTYTTKKFLAQEEAATRPPAIPQIHSDTSSLTDPFPGATLEEKLKEKERLIKQQRAEQQQEQQQQVLPSFSSNEHESIDPRAETKRQDGETRHQAVQENDDDDDEREGGEDAEPKENKARARADPKDTSKVATKKGRKLRARAESKETMSHTESRKTSVSSKKSTSSKTDDAIAASQSTEKRRGSLLIRGFANFLHKSSSASTGAATPLFLSLSGKRPSTEEDPISKDENMTSKNKTPSAEKDGSDEDDHESDKEKIVKEYAPMPSLSSSLKEHSRTDTFSPKSTLTSALTMTKVEQEDPSVDEFEVVSVALSQDYYNTSKKTTHTLGSRESGATAVKTQKYSQASMGAELDAIIERIDSSITPKSKASKTKKKKKKKAQYSELGLPEELPSDGDLNETAVSKKQPTSKKEKATQERQSYDPVVEKPSMKPQYTPTRHFRDALDAIEATRSTSNQIPIHCKPDAVEMQRSFSPKTAASKIRRGFLSLKTKNRVKSDSSEIRLTETEQLNMYSRSLISEDSMLSEAPLTAGTEKSANKKKKKQKGSNAIVQAPAPNELDEYSLGENEKVEQAIAEPQLVQCLKFYYCGGAANVLDVTLKSMDCARKRQPQIQGAADATDEIMEQRLNDESNSPWPALEVVLNAGKAGSLQSFKSGLKQGSKDLNIEVNSLNGEKIDLIELQEAPSLRLPRTPTYVKEVTAMSLHLDDDFEANARDSAMARAKKKAEDEELSITTIEIPTATTTTDEQDNEGDDEEDDEDDNESIESNEEDEEEDAAMDEEASEDADEETEVMTVASAISGKSGTRRAIGRFFSRFRRRHEV